MMAALADYLDLRFAVSDHVNNRTISDVMPRLVQMAEARLNRKLRTRYQVTDANLIFTNGSAPLPDDFLQVLFVYDANSYPMEAGTQNEYLRTWNTSGYQIGPGTITVTGYSGDRAIQYYAKLPTLTTSPTTSNWLLENYPDAYLYAVSVEAAKFLRDVDLMAATESLLYPVLREVRVDDERARWSGAAVRVQGLTP